MCRGEHKVLVAVDECSFLLCIGSPKNEDEVFALLGEAAYGSIGECFPSPALVRTGLMCLHGERSVEQQHTLTCPAGEVAIWREGLAKVAQDLLKMFCSEGGLGTPSATEKHSPCACPGPW